MENTDNTVLDANSDDDFDKLSSASDDDEVTDEDLKSLRRIADQLPWSVWYRSPFLPFLLLNSYQTDMY